MTREDRIEKVSAALGELPALVAKAQQVERGTSAARAADAWAAVEQAGAVIHRQARLLAGKPRGG